MNMKSIIEWTKGNVLIVVLGGVALVSLGIGWYFSGSVNESVRKLAQDRAAMMNDLTALEKSSVTLNIPGQEPLQKQVVINGEILEEYRSAVATLKKDADRIRQLAVAKNKGDHRVVLDGVFPVVTSDGMREVVHLKLHPALVSEYERLFEESVRAGMPPSAESVAEALARRESQFISSVLKKPNREALDAREKVDLAEELTRNRLALYVEQAQRIAVYADPSVAGLPQDPRGKAVPSSAELFEWQWRFWIVSDIMRAVADAAAAANPDSADPSVLRNPVKRILSISIDTPSFVAPRGSQGSGSGVGGSGFGGMGMGSSSDAGIPGADGAPPPAPADPNAPLGLPQVDVATEAPRDFSKSLTGWQPNSVYDVRRAVVSAIVDTANLPVFFDALAKRNFITITDVSVEPAYPFEDARLGFIYGKAPVSRVRIVIESVWLREWMAPLMPRDVRTALGIPEQPADAAAPAASAG